MTRPLASPMGGLEETTAESADPPRQGPIGLEQLGIRPRDRVLVLGGYGVRNVGDEAILSGLLSRLPPGVQVKVISRSPAETSALHGIPAASPATALPLLLRTDALIVGGGGLFSGHMGPYARLIPIFGLLAAVRGARVALLGVGVYASTPGWVLSSLDRLAPRLASFTVRDTVSLETLRRRGIKAELAPDFSDLITPGSREKGRELLRSAGVEEGRPVVGLCLTAAEPRLEEQVLQETPAVIEAFPEAQFCFVPMSQHPSVKRQNDLELARRLRQRAPALAILEGWHHPAAVLAVFGLLDAAVCMRYHSLLFAARAQVPIVPLPYSAKCESWLREHGLEGNGLTAEAIVQRLEATMPAGRAT